MSHLDRFNEYLDDRLKTLKRREKIRTWRRKKVRKKRGPMPLYEKIWAVGMGSGIVIAAILDKFALAEVFTFIGLLGAIAFAGADWYRGRYRGKRSFFATLIVSSLVPLSMLGLSASMHHSGLFTNFPQQVATDAYVKEHAEEIGRNVDHFVSLHASGDTRGPKDGNLSQHSPMPPALSFAMFRLPLLVKTWKGDVSKEDVERYTMWHFQDLSATWGVFPRSLTKEEIEAEATSIALPPSATHPYIGALMCWETRAGRIIVDPIFLGTPSDDVDRPDFEPFSDAEKEKAVGHLGRITMPYPLYGFDAATLDFMAPLADVCRDMKPAAKAVD